MAAFLSRPEYVDYELTKNSCYALEFLCNTVYYNFVGGGGGVGVGWGGGGGGGGGGGVLSTHSMKVTTYAPPFWPPFIRSLENLYSFYPYIWAKMRKMSYFDPYFSSKWYMYHIECDTTSGDYELTEDTLYLTTGKLWSVSCKHFGEWLSCFEEDWLYVMKESVYQFWGKIILRRYHFCACIYIYIYDIHHLRLTHGTLVIPYGDKNLSQHWLRQRLVAGRHQAISWGAFQKHLWALKSKSS